MANSVVTNIAKKKLVQARAGLIPRLPVVAGMAFGDGAVSGSLVRTPLETDIGLQHELHRQHISRATLQEDEISVLYESTLEKLTLAGQVINEIALYDDEGDFLAIKSFSNKGKDDDMEMVFEILDKF